MRNSAMAPIKAPTYVGGMPTDLAAVVAANFRRIRQRRGGTQERFAERTGWSQGQISEMETAKRWAFLRRVGEQLEGAGINPHELLVPAAEEPPAYVREAVELLRSADETTREALLLIMRSVAAQGQRARG
jgi:transcriptional regulator with XRE-family HTH domain